MIMACVGGCQGGDLSGHVVTGILRHWAPALIGTDGTLLFSYLPTFEGHVAVSLASVK